MLYPDRSIVNKKLIRCRFWEILTFFSFYIRTICYYLQKRQTPNRATYDSNSTHSIFLDVKKKWISELSVSEASNKPNLLWTELPCYLRYICVCTGFGNAWNCLLEGSSEYTTVGVPQRRTKKGRRIERAQINFSERWTCFLLNYFYFACSLTGTRDVSY